MKPTPEGWPRISAAVYYEDAWADRQYQCEDPGGHRWWFAERVTPARG